MGRAVLTVENHGIFQKENFQFGDQSKWSFREGVTPLPGFIPEGRDGSNCNFLCPSLQVTDLTMGAWAVTPRTWGFGHKRRFTFPQEGELPLLCGLLTSSFLYYVRSIHVGTAGTRQRDDKTEQDQQQAHRSGKLLR